MDLKTLLEERAAFNAKLDAFDKELKEDEKRSSFTTDEQKEYSEILDKRNALDTSIDFEEKREADILKRAKNQLPGDLSVQKLNKEEKRAAKDFDFAKAVKQAVDNQRFEGLEKEIIQEGTEEARSGGWEHGGLRILVPSKMMDYSTESEHEKRTDIDQATSALAPTFLGAYTDALRENAIYNQIPAINTYSLTADFKLPITVAQSLAWATAENSAAADGGANFTSDTLTPFRLAGFVDISNKMVIQNGSAVTQNVMKDLGRAEAALINTAMFSTASVTNAPPSLAAKAGVLTFVEGAFSAGVSVLANLLQAEQAVANDHGLSGNLLYVLSTELLTEVKKSAEVASILAGMTSRSYNDYQVNGYQTKFTTGATKIAGTSGDGIFGDFSRVHFGRFGGLNILVDPFTVAGNDQVRLVVNSNVDWSLVQGPAFVKFTSLTA